MQDYVINNYSFLLPFNMRQPITGQEFADKIRAYSNAEQAQEAAKFAEIWVKNIKRWRGTVRVMTYTHEFMLNKNKGV